MFIQCYKKSLYYYYYYFIIYLDSFLQSDWLLVGLDYLVRTAGIMNFSKNFENSQNNLKNDFKELRKISEIFRRIPNSSEDF